MIENKEQLREKISLINSLITEVNQFIGPNDPDEYDSIEFLIRIPRNYIRTVETLSNRFMFLEDNVLRKNISYALQLSDFNTWILNRTDIGLSVRELFIKQSIILLGSVVEAVLVSHSKRKFNNKLSFQDRTTKYLEAKLISLYLKGEIDWLWNARNFVHINKSDQKEYGRYSDEMYTRAMNVCIRLADELSEQKKPT